ncbi:hypothetical protein [Caulobacter sp. 3R27C2-B]|jgi:hypothetical protein|uniref:hypothetical protein n=1 Tax=Caulobacter sp. 3R27C2-B TaxID=2502219 RepID=UPI0010F6E49A|nr:hypothetical protein [Caulobacter sp. 3R27C2-B]
MTYESPAIEQDVVANARRRGHKLFRVIVLDVTGRYGRLTHYQGADRARALANAEAMARSEIRRQAIVEEIDTANGRVVSTFKPEA